MPVNPIQPRRVGSGSEVTKPMVTGRSVAELNAQAQRTAEQIVRGSGAYATTQAGVLATQGRRDRVLEMMVRTTRVTGFLLVGGIGFARHQIELPVSFIERPAVTFGVQVADGSEIDTIGWKNFPEVYPLVTKWYVNFHPQVDSEIYYACDLAVKVVSDKSADPPVQFWLNWAFEGQAYRNPAHNIEMTGVI